MARKLINLLGGIITEIIFTAIKPFTKHSSNKNTTEDINTMKRSIYLGLIVLFVCSLSACDNYNYYIAARNKTNMSGYHSFAWMQGGASKDNATVDAAIKSSTTLALQSKGLALKQQKPDLLVSYTVTVGRGTRTNYYTSWGYPGWGWGLGWGWGGGWHRGWGLGWGGWYGGYYGFGPYPYAGGLTYEDQESYKEGTLIIDLIDRKTRKVVWRGFGVGEVHHNQQKNIDDLPKVVDGILKQLIVTPQGYYMRTMNS